MKKIIFLCLSLMLMGCGSTSTNGTCNAGVIDLVDSVVCKAYWFVGDSLADKTEPVTYSFTYDEKDCLVSYHCNNGYPVDWDKKHQQWAVNEISNLFPSCRALDCVDNWKDNLSAVLWPDLANMSIMLNTNLVDSIVPTYDTDWKRFTNIDFANPYGWICTGYETATPDNRVSTLIEYYPSMVVYDTFCYAHGPKDLPIFINQSRNFPNGITQIITYRMWYRNVQATRDIYYDTLQIRRWPIVWVPVDNLEESEI